LAGADDLILRKRDFVAMTGDSILNTTPFFWNPIMKYLIYTPYLIIAFASATLAQNAGEPTNATEAAARKTEALEVNSLSAEETAKGFVSLFDGESFEGWEQKGNWTIEEGAFFRKERGGSLTYTNALVPDDFELRFEWKVS
jgi:hypothetical protein